MSNKNGGHRRLKKIDEALKDGFQVVPDDIDHKDAIEVLLAQQQKSLWTAKLNLLEEQYKSAQLQLNNQLLKGQLIRMDQSADLRELEGLSFKDLQQHMANLEQ